MLIKEKDEIFEEIQEAFSNIRKPSRFLDDPQHCEECAEHNETLCNSTRETVSLKELGNPGWDPLCYVTPQGFMYYFPAMVRLSLDSESDNDYLDQFLFHTTYEGIDNRHIQQFTKQQVRVTLDLLRFFKFNWKKKLDKMCLSEDVDRAIEIWTELLNKKA